MSEPILNPGEVVIRKASGQQYFSDGRSGIWLTLTNQRLIVQRWSKWLGSDESFPLSHVTLASEHDYLQPRAFYPIKVLRIDFDNGGAALYGIPEKPAWILAIEQAKASAPQMPYTSTPGPLPSRPVTSRWVWIAIIVVAVMLVCLSIPIAIMILLNLSSR